MAQGHVAWWKWPVMFGIFALFGVWWTLAWVHDEIVRVLRKAHA